MISFCIGRRYLYVTYDPGIYNSGVCYKERVTMSTVTTKQETTKQETKKPSVEKTIVPKTRINVRKMTMTAMLSAVAFILMFLDFSVPFVPGFIKMDLSELPALIGAFSMGPISGVLICLIKNLLHLFMTSTGGVGELSNFILGVCFVLPAGLVYKRRKGKKAAAIGALAGAVLMAVVSIFSNYYITYPFYFNVMELPEETVLGMYQAIFQGVDSILECLIVFNMPFTFVKGLFSVVITLLIYKPLSPIIKGVHQ